MVKIRRSRRRHGLIDATDNFCRGQWFDYQPDWSLILPIGFWLIGLVMLALVCGGAWLFFTNYLH